MLPRDETRSTRASIYNTLCVATAVWLLTATVIIAAQFFSPASTKKLYSSIIPAHESTTQILHTPSQSSMAFTQIPGLEDMTSSGDQFWEHWQQTPKGGFLWVDSSHPQPQQWGVSMFHALHCLELIRAALVKDQNKATHNRHDRDMPDAHSDHNGTSHEMHLPHCLSYVAQYIICAADGTLEPPKEKRDARGFILDSRVDGMGVEHQCRDTSLLFDLVERSEKSTVARWPWKTGDSIQSVFENGK